MSPFDRPLRQSGAGPGGGLHRMRHGRPYRHRLCQRHRQPAGPGRSKDLRLCGRGFGGESQAGHGTAAGAAPARKESAPGDQASGAQDPGGRTCQGDASGTGSPGSGDPRPPSRAKTRRFFRRQTRRRPKAPLSLPRRGRRKRGPEIRLPFRSGQR